MKKLEVKMTKKAKEADEKLAEYLENTRPMTYKEAVEQQKRNCKD